MSNIFCCTVQGHMVFFKWSVTVRTENKTYNDEMNKSMSHLLLVLIKPFRAAFRHIAYVLNKIGFMHDQKI